MSQAYIATSPPPPVDVATWELVCFCLYNENEKRELLGNPRLPMRTIDEIFLCRAILGKLFLTLQDCKDLQRRLRTSGFSDDLTTLPVLRSTLVHEAYERAKQSLKPSYSNDEKSINKKWYKDNSFSIEVLMLMTQNSMHHRLRRKLSPSSPYQLHGDTFTSNTDSDDPTWSTDIPDHRHEEMEGPPRKKCKPNEETIPNYCDTKAFNNSNIQAGRCFAPKPVPITPIRDYWEESLFHPWPIDLTAVDVPPVTIDITQSHDDDDDDDDNEVLVEQNPPVLVHHPSSQPEEEAEVNTPILLNQADSQDTNQTSMVLQTKDQTAMVHYLENGDQQPKRYCRSVLVSTLAAWLLGFHLLGATQLGLDHAGFWGGPNNPRQICFAVDPMTRPRIYPFSSTLDLGTFLDANHDGPWLDHLSERES